MTPFRPSQSAPGLSAILLIVAGLFALNSAVYWGVHEFAFVNFDDDVHVYDNPFVNTGLSAQNSWWALGIHGPSQWHPLAWLSHQLDCEVFGLWPGGHHLTNVALHVANVLLLFVWLTGLTHAIWRSAFVAALFAIHPLNVESVAWVSERRNVLCLLFCLLTLILYGQYVHRGGRFRYLGVLILFALALMSKPLAVTLPFVLLLLDYWPLNRFNDSVVGHRYSSLADGSKDSHFHRRATIRSLVIEKVPLLLMAAAACVLTILCQRDVVVSDELLPVGVRVLNTFAAYGLYLRKILWPVDLGVFYPHPGVFSSDPMSELIGPAIIGFTVVAAISAAAVWFLRRRACLGVGWLWFLGTLVPMIGLVQVGRQQLADRYVYLPLIGLLIAITWMLPDLRKSGWRHTITALALSIIGLLAFTARGQLGTWRTGMSLYEQALRVTRENSWAENNLGIALHQHGDSAGAVDHLQRAVEMDPDYALARYNLGVVLHDLGRTPLAIPHFETAVKLTPKHVDSRLRLGIARADMGDLSAAREQFEEALLIDPRNSDSHFNLGLTLSLQGLPRQSIEQYRLALDDHPVNDKARYALAEALRSVGDLDESEKYFRELMERAPFASLAHQGLGKVLLEQGERSRALEHFREALRLDPSLRESREILRRESTL